MRTAEEIMRYPFRAPGVSYAELAAIADDFDREAGVSVQSPPGGGFGVSLHPSTGTGNGAAKMNEEKVRAIRHAAEAGANLARLAAAFGISTRAARHIVKGTSWGHVK
jgi:hypothetical protein